MFKGTATNRSFSSEIVPEGPHQAILIALVDLGSHSQERDDGTEHFVRRVLVIFEIPGEKMTDVDATHVIAKDYTLTFSPKSKLRKLLETIRGKTFQDGEEIDVTAGLGKPVLVNVVHGVSKKGKTFANLDAVMKFPPKDVPPKPTRPLQTWSIEENDLKELPLCCPMWLYGEKIEEFIQRSAEWKPKHGQQAQHVSRDATEEEVRTPWDDAF